MKVSEICNENFEIDPNGNFYCFNLSFYHMDPDKINSLRFACFDNCTNPEGNPALLYIQLYARNLRIDHTEKEPLILDSRFGDALHVAVNENLYEGAIFFLLQ